MSLSDDPRTAAAYSAASWSVRPVKKGDAADIILAGIGHDAVLWLARGARMRDPQMVAVVSGQLLWVRGLGNPELHRCHLGHVLVQDRPGADWVQLSAAGDEFRVAANDASRASLRNLLNSAAKDQATLRSPPPQPSAGAAPHLPAMTPPTRTLKDDLRTVAAFKAAPRLTRWAASGKAAETLLEGLEPGSVVGWISTGRQTGDPGLVAMTATEVLWVRGILNFTLHRCSLADTEVTVGPDADHAVFRTLGGTFQAAVDAPTKEALFALLGESPREAVIHMSDGVERIAEWDAEGAESLAMRHMITIGFRDAQLTNPGPDDGLDVISAKGAAQVKHHHKPVGSKDVQQHFGAAASYEHKLFYALSGYTPKARAEAERLGIVLFSYRPDGVVVPENQRARILAPSPILPQGISQHQVLKAWANRRS